MTKRRPPAPTPYAVQRAEEKAEKHRRYRYVEVMSKIATDGRIRAYLPEGPVSLREAEHAAVEDAAAAWGLTIYDVDVYLVRTVTPEKHDKIYRAIVDGTWEPWSHKSWAPNNVA